MPVSVPVSVPAPPSPCSGRWRALSGAYLLPKLPRLCLAAWFGGQKGTMRSVKSKTKKTEILPVGLPKCPTGIHGLDDITLGGIPRGRPTLVCGGAGCGKTLLGMEFLVRGATQFNEPGVFMAFEETAKDLTQNVASLGFDLKDLVARKKIVLA